jgi:hypothetical protein
VKELLEPIVYVALTIFTVGAAIIMPMLVYMMYKEITQDRQ